MEFHHLWRNLGRSLNFGKKIGLGAFAITACLGVISACFPEQLFNSSTILSGKSFFSSLIATPIAATVVGLTVGFCTSVIHAAPSALLGLVKDWRENRSSEK